MQADAYGGYNGLYVEGRKPGPIIEVACWAHARRYFYELARLNKAPIGIEAVARHNPTKVLIHDAARPFVSPALIDSVIAFFGTSSRVGNQPSPNCCLRQSSSRSTTR